MFKTIKRWFNHHTNRQIGTYMNRWYVIPPAWGLPICVRLQHIKRPDGERIPHNHPYAFKSIVLKGWYLEEQVMDFCELAPGHELMAFEFKPVYHSAFKVFQIEQKRYHRVIDMAKGGVWTLIWHPRKVQESAWGYLDVDGQHIPHDEYVRPPGYDLPYKASSYRRDGPTGTQGPGGPDGERGHRGPGGDAGVSNTSFDVELRGSLEVEVVNAAIYNPNAVQKGERI
jgi:hypothetical protein